MFYKKTVLDNFWKFQENKVEDLSPATLLNREPNISLLMDFVTFFGKTSYHNIGMTTTAREMLLISKLLGTIYLLTNQHLLVQSIDKSTKIICEICSNLTIKTLERCHSGSSGVFIVNFKKISHVVLEFPLLTLNK